MTLGYIGLGKMGHNMVLRLLEKGHKVVAFDMSEKVRREIAKTGAKTVNSIRELVSSLKPPRTVWVMVPAAAVDDVLRELMKFMKRGDTIIEGGNSYYELTVKRAKKVTAKGIRFLDVAVSGGPRGARKGACLMVGGERMDYTRLIPLFRDLAQKDAYAYFGRHGAGHFVKMVHNGIEYGMMQAIAEGFNVLRTADLRGLNADNRGKLRYKFDLIKIANLYNHGSVVESRLVGWLGDAFREYGPQLKAVSGSVGATGEGEWTVKTAKKFGVPVPIIKGAFDFRVASKKNPSYAGKVLSGMRNQFGGHSVK